MCKVTFEQIYRTWGNGWKLLGEDIKRAIIAERVLSIFLGMDDEIDVSPKLIREHLQAMLFYCGLDDFEPETIP